MSRKWFSWSGEPVASAPMRLMDRLYTELKTMDAQTSTSITVLCCSITFLGLISYYYKWKLKKRFENIDSSLQSVDDRVHAKQAVEGFLMYTLELCWRMEESMNMALFMSEMRKKAKTRRPRRPSLVKDRAPELLPTLRAERCEKDGLAVLDISYDETPRPKDKVSSEEPLGEVLNKPEETPAVVGTPRPKRRHFAAKP